MLAKCVQVTGWYISPYMCIQITVLWFNPISVTRIMSPTAEKSVVWWIEMLKLTTSQSDDRLVLIESHSFYVSLSITVSVCQHCRHVLSNTSGSCTWKLNNMDGCICLLCLFALKASDLFRLILWAIWIWLWWNMKAPLHFLPVNLNGAVAGKVVGEARLCV